MLRHQMQIFTMVLCLLGVTAWENPSPAFPRNYGTGPKAAAMSLDASKMIIIAKSKIYITTGHDFASRVEKDLSGTLEAIAMSHDGTKVCIVATSGGKVYVSSDSGENFAEVASLGTKNWAGASMSSDGSKIVVCNNPSFSGGDTVGYLQMSSDGGSTWSQLSVTGRFRDCEMSPDGQIIVATPEEGNVQISTDSGATFTSRGQVLKWSRVAMSSDGSKMIANLIYSGQPGYVSLDSGVTWTQPTNGGDSEWDDVAITPDGSKMYALGGGGSGKIWSSTDGTTWVEELSSQKNWDRIAISPDGNVVIAFEQQIVVNGWPTPTSSTTTTTTTTTSPSAGSSTASSAASDSTNSSASTSAAPAGSLSNGAPSMMQNMVLALGLLIVSCF